MGQTSRIQPAIPVELHRLCKVAAASEGRTLNDVVTEALERWLWAHHPALAGVLPDAVPGAVDLLGSAD